MIVMIGLLEKVKEEASQHRTNILKVKMRHASRNQSLISLPSFHRNPEALKFIRTNKVTFWLYDDGKAWQR